MKQKQGGSTKKDQQKNREQKKNEEQKKTGDQKGNGEPGPTEPITARTLRGLGEKADAMRGVKLALVRKKNATDSSRFDILPHSEALGRQDLDIIDIVETSTNLPQRDWMNVEVSVPGRTVVLPPGTDAAFWSESAADKFVWPYYEGMRIWSEDYLERLKDAFKHPNVTGLLHVIESESWIVDESGAARIVVGGDGLEGSNVLTLKEFKTYLLTL